MRMPFMFKATRNLVRLGLYGRVFYLWWRARYVFWPWCPTCGFRKWGINYFTMGRICHSCRLDNIYKFMDGCTDDT